jgi:Lipocalin-like domain
MNSRTVLGVMTSMVLCTGIVLSSSFATAQQKSLKEQLIGTWTIVSNDNVAPDGTKRQLFGPNPKGILVLAANGHYAQIIVHPDRPNFKVNNRLEGTPEENTAAVHGTTATFGTWSVDEASTTLIVRNEGGMFPNQVGTESKRSVTLAGDQLRIGNPNPASGGRSESVWKRGATVASN